MKRYINDSTIEDGEKGNLNVLSYPSFMCTLPTPHNSAKLGEISETVLMPGDPLRAKFIAEKFLTDVKCFTSVRNMLGFTGLYKNKRISIMGSGMGIPSIGIYSYELYKFYGVENIIRIGSAGAINSNIKLRDIVIAMGACTDSNFMSQYNLGGTFAPIADFNLLKKAYEFSNKLNINTHVGNVRSSDVFYSEPDSLKKWDKMGVLAVEMEAAGLYANAARLNKKALCILTISDCPLTGLSLTSDERQTSFCNMVEIALNTGVNI